MTHVKVVCGENGYSLPNSNETTSSLEQFVEVFTFKESQLTNIPLKPVRLPNEKVEELKKKGIIMLVIYNWKWKFFPWFEYLEYSVSIRQNFPYDKYDFHFIYNDSFLVVLLSDCLASYVHHNFVEMAYHDY